MVEPLAQLLQGPASAQAQVIPQQLQLLPAAADQAHQLHVLVQRGVHQLQVDEGLGPDLRQEPQGLPADRALGEVPVVDDPGRNHRGIVLVADVTVIEAREGTKLGSYK